MIDNPLLHAAGECPVCEGQTLEYGEMVMAGDGSGNASIPWKCDFCESEGEENYNLQFLSHEVTKKGEIPQDDQDDEDDTPEGGYEGYCLNCGQEGNVCRGQCDPR